MEDTVMRQNCILLIWLGLALLVFYSVALGEPLSNLLEKAIYAEETKGDLNEAIRIYQQIVNNPKADPKHDAQAQFRLGKCFLKKKDRKKQQGNLRRSFYDFPTNRNW